MMKYDVLNTRNTTREIFHYFPFSQYFLISTEYLNKDKHKEEKLNGNVEKEWAKRHNQTM